MAHHIYHTRGIILSNVATGEANRFYKLLTEDLGLIGAVAQGVREGKGKLKTMLQEFSRIKVDLVRGKEVWRIISAMEERPAGGLKKQGENMVLFARMASLVRRLVHGEGRNDELFRDMLAAHDFLEMVAIPANLVPAFETLSTLRVLVWLGYFDASSYEMFCKLGPWTMDMLTEWDKVHSRAVSDINAALKASQL
ncbi:MAG: recombination protein O N-terminal domain-containing protein [Patescibacteria group bacterium]